MPKSAKIHHPERFVRSLTGVLENQIDSSIDFPRQCSTSAP
jgi:hypothetical protein